jgi:hypothetical protein
LILLCSSLILNFIAYPLWQRNRALNSEITKTRLKLIKFLEVLNKKEGGQNFSPESSSDLRALEQKQDTLVAVLAELELLSQKANIKILDIRPQTLTKTHQAKETSFDLRLEGDIEGYIKFIYGIENSVFLLRIKKIQLRAKADSALIDGAFTIVQTHRI